MTEPSGRRTWLDSWSGIGRVAVGMARQGLRSPAHPVRRARLAGDVLHDGDGALADERDGHRVGAHGVACDAASGWGATPGSGPGSTVNRPTCPRRPVLMAVPTGDDLVLDLRKLYSVTPTLGGDPFQRNDGALIVRHSLLAGVRPIRPAFAISGNPRGL